MKLLSSRWWSPCPLILHRYLWREFWGLFGVGLVVITAIIFMGRITRVMQMIITKGVDLADICYFCLLMLPYLLFYTIPMAAMVAVLITFLRLSHDNEIMALKTSGVSLDQLLPPVLAFGLITTLAALFFANFATPWSNQAMRQLLVEITKRRADLGIREQVFNNDFEKIVLFVNRVPPSGEPMTGVFLADERDPNLPMVIAADQAKLVFDPKSTRLVLQLYHGRLLRQDESKNTFYSVEFETYQVPLEIFKFVAPEKSEDEMYWHELRQALTTKTPGSEAYNRLLIEQQRRLALPLATLILVLIALPLGSSTQVRGRGMALILGLLLFLCYYLLLTASWRLGRQGVIPPPLAPWLPDVIFLGLTLLLWRWALRDQPLGLVDWDWQHWRHWLANRLRLRPD